MYIYKERPFAIDVYDGWSNERNTIFSGWVQIDSMTESSSREVFIRLAVYRGSTLISDSAIKLTDYTPTLSPTPPYPVVPFDYYDIFSFDTNLNYTGVYRYTLSLYVLTTGTGSITDLTTLGAVPFESYTGEIEVNLNWVPTISAPSGLSGDIFSGGVEITWWASNQLPVGVTEDQITYRVYRGTSPAIRDLTLIGSSQVYTLQQYQEEVSSSSYEDTRIIDGALHDIIVNTTTNDYTVKRRYRFIDNTTVTGTLYYYYVVAVASYVSIVDSTSSGTAEVSYYSDYIIVNPGLRWQIYNTLRLPNISQTEWKKRMAVQILSKFPNADVTQGNPNDDLILYPVSTVLNDIYAVAQFTNDRNSVTRLLEIDDSNGDGVSDSIDTSIYKQNLKRVLGSGTDVQALIDASFDYYASNFGITRKTSTNAIGSVVLYTTTIPIRDITIPDGAIVGTSATTPIKFSVVGEHTILKDSITTYYNSTTGRYEITVPIRAMLSGILGNVPAYTINSVFSGITGGLRVENILPVYGGQDYESNRSLAQRVLILLSGLDVGTSGGYRSSALSMLDVEGVRVEGAMDEYQYRDWDEARLRHIGGCVDVYLKGYVPEVVTERFPYNYRDIVDLDMRMLGGIQAYRDTDDSLVKVYSWADDEAPMRWFFKDTGELSFDNYVLDKCDTYIESRVPSGTVIADSKYYIAVYEGAQSWTLRTGAAEPWLTLNDATYGYQNATPYDLSLSWKERVVKMESVTIPTLVATTVSLSDANVWNQQWVWTDYKYPFVQDDGTPLYLGAGDYIDMPANYLYGNIILIEVTKTQYENIFLEFPNYDEAPLCSFKNVRILEDIYFDLTKSAIREVSSATIDSQVMPYNVIVPSPLVTDGNTSKNKLIVGIEPVISGTDMYPSADVVSTSMTFDFRFSSEVVIVDSADAIAYGVLEDSIVVSDGVTTYTNGHHYVISRQTDGSYIIYRNSEILDPILTSTSLTMTYNYVAPVTISYIRNHVVDRVETSIETRRHITADVLVKEAPEVNTVSAIDIVIEDGADTQNIRSNSSTYIADYVRSLKVGEGLYQSDLIHEVEKVSGVSHVDVPLRNLCLEDNSYYWVQFDNLRFTNLLRFTRLGKERVTGESGDRWVLYPLLSDTLLNPCIGNGYNSVWRDRTPVFVGVKNEPIPIINTLVRSPWSSTVLIEDFGSLVEYPLTQFPTCSYAENSGSGIPVASTIAGVDNQGAFPISPTDYRDSVYAMIVSDDWVNRVLSRNTNGRIDGYVESQLDGSPSLCRILLLVGRNVYSRMGIRSEDIDGDTWTGGTDGWGTIGDTPAVNGYGMFAYDLDGVTVDSIYIPKIHVGYWVNGESDIYGVHDIRSYWGQISLNSLELSVREE